MSYKTLILKKIIPASDDGGLIQKFDSLDLSQREGVIKYILDKLELGGSDSLAFIRNKMVLLQLPLNSIDEVVCTWDSYLQDRANSEKLRAFKIKEKAFIEYVKSLCPGI
ncbi:hypothetical protein ACFL96_04355 [Thermoproteota archaeon]